MQSIRKTLLMLAAAGSICRAGDIPLKEGDIVFQTIPSPQALAIQIATRSKFNHVGVVLMHGGKLMIYEAYGHVVFTPIDAWVERDTNRHVVVKRLRAADSVLTKSSIAKLESAALRFDGRPYDFGFSWSDKELYCSELVWKIFHGALGINLGALRKLESFDLSSPIVQAKLREQHPNGIPMEETVISPQDIYESGLLVTTYKQ